MKNFNVILSTNSAILNIRSVILSVHSVILSAAKYLALAALTANILASCEKATITENTIGHDVILRNDLSIDVRCFDAVKGTVYIVLTENEQSVRKSIHVSCSQPLDYSETLIVKYEPSLVQTFSDKEGISYQPLPYSFFRLENDGVINLDENYLNGATLSLEIRTSNSFGAHLSPGRYLLPLKCESIGHSVNNDIMLFDILIRESFEGEANLYEDNDLFIVFYVDTRVYDPRLVTDYYFFKEDIFNDSDYVWYNAVGNILNLRKVSIRYDFLEQKPLLDLGPDVRYVLDHYDTYILPIKETGRKVCLCIEGGGDGIGFCNLSDEQIFEFSRQIKQIIENYNLDGINLWDKDSGYGKNNLPPMNTTSYPKLIKNLRKVLGDSVIITVTDHGIPTASFGDIAATGGIEVGEYIDFAWSGYNNRADGYQVVDPYHIGEPMVSSYTHEPFLGLDKEKYGCINFPWCAPPYNVSEDAFGEGIANLVSWISAGYRQSNIVVYEDIRSNIQDAIETSYEPGFCLGWLMQDCIQNGGHYIYSFDSQFIKNNDQGVVHSQYNKWIKNNWSLQRHMGVLLPRSLCMWRQMMKTRSMQVIIIVLMVLLLLTLWNCSQPT